MRAPGTIPHPNTENRFHRVQKMYNLLAAISAETVWSDFREATSSGQMYDRSHKSCV